MKKIILCAIAISSLLMASCDYTGVEKAEGKIMVGNKPYKMVDITLHGHYVRVLVPADSSVTVIPANATFQNGKNSESVIYVQ